MNKKLLGIFIGLIVLGAIVIGFTVYKNSQTPATQTVIEEEEPLAVADESIVADVAFSKVKSNTLVLTISGLKSGYKTVAYEISYETKGVVQGLIDKPMDISGKDTFTKDDIYLGTCSKNVCTPHTGVTKVSLVLEFTDLDGKKSQLSKDFDL